MHLMAVLWSQATDTVYPIVQVSPPWVQLALALIPALATVAVAWVKPRRRRKGSDE